MVEDECYSCGATEGDLLTCECALLVCLDCEPVHRTECGAEFDRDDELADDDEDDPDDD